MANKKISTRDKIFYYRQHHDKHIEYISGKWFYDGIEIKNIRNYLIELDISTYGKSFNKFQYEFKEPADLDNWISYYEIAYGKEGEWYPTKYAKTGEQYSKEHKDLPTMAYPLNYKQLTIIGVMLFKPLEEVLFITSGRGGSGKSTFGNIVKQLFENDVASCSLSDLSNDFIMAEAITHRLIYSDELSSDDVNLPNIKIIASKQALTCNRKNMRPIYVTTQSAFLSNCNKAPKLDIEDTGMMRRMIYYFMDTKVVNPDLSLKKKKYTDEELTIIAAHAYRTLRDNWRKDFEKETYEQIISGNSVYINKAFFVYSDYKNACYQQGLKPYSEPKWKKIKEYIDEHEEEDLPF